MPFGDLLLLPMASFTVFSIRGAFRPSIIGTAIFVAELDMMAPDEAETRREAHRVVSPGGGRDIRDRAENRYLALILDQPAVGCPGRRMVHTTADIFQR